MLLKFILNWSDMWIGLSPVPQIAKDHYLDYRWWSSSLSLITMRLFLGLMYFQEKALILTEVVFFPLPFF